MKQKLNKIKRLLAVAIVVASVSLAAVIAMKLRGGHGPEEMLVGLPKNIDISLHNIHYTETKNGVKQWDLVAQQADYDRSGNATHLKSIKMILFGGKKCDDITLTADRALFNNTTKDVKLTGHVLARSAAGLRFTTGRADYLAAHSMISTDDHVQLVDGRLTVEGVGMELLLKPKTAKVLNKVTATVMAEAR